MPYKITLIPGDGIGPEITEAAVRVMEASGVDIRWEVKEAGISAAEKYGDVLPQDLLDSIRRNKVALKAPVTTPRASGFRSVNVALRKALDLYACLRPAKWYPGARSRYENIDLVVIRENHEDLYAGLEFERGDPAIARISDMLEERSQDPISPDTGISLKIASEYGSRRIARFAFEYARSYGRRKVTMIAKDTIMKYSDGLFSAVAREVAGEYPDIEYEEMLVDNMTMQLVQNPERYDVLLLPNLYGDIFSDLCAGLIGGLGLAPGANLGDDLAVFEPVHGSAPKYAGLNRVNPMAMMFSGMLMLRHLGEGAAADRLEQAIAAVIAEGRHVTADIKPRRDDPTAVGTAQVGDAVIEKLKAM
ncbi:MAG: isocitrate/isopropylmalate dehydrogenase family protein [Dehalococcoidia bacterium]